MEIKYRVYGIKIDEIAYRHTTSGHLLNECKTEQEAQDFIDTKLTKEKWYKIWTEENKSYSEF